jgi:hypothetical protein
LPDKVISSGCLYYEFAKLAWQNEPFQETGDKNKPQKSPQARNEREPIMRATRSKEIILNSWEENLAFATILFSLMDKNSGGPFSRMVILAEPILEERTRYNNVPHSL